MRIIKELVRSRLRNILRFDFHNIYKEIEFLKDEINLLGFKAAKITPNISDFWATRNESEQFYTDELFIIGSGSSLLTLKDEEKAYISNKKTIAMNRYILYWDIIGVWPTFVYLADSLGIAKRAFLRMQQLVLESNHQSPIFFLDTYYENFVHPDIPVVFFNRDDTKGSQLIWASELNQPLFFHIGSLTSLLNLISVLKIAPVVKLIGIDLYLSDYFFQKHQNRYPDLINPWDHSASLSGKHYTIANTHGKGTILDYWETINQKLSESNISLYCSNPVSLLVKKNYVEFRPIID